MILAAPETKTAPRTRADILTATTPPPLMPVAVDAIPAELRHLDRWLGWSFEYDADRKRWNKPPKDARTGRYASSTNPATWCSFDTAMAAYQAGAVDGLGFVLGDGFAGVDLDDVRDPETGELCPEAQVIVEEFGTYAEVSPTGTGVKLLCRGEKPQHSCKAKLTRQGEVELYDGGRYFTITGQRLATAPESLADASDKLRWLQSRYMACVAEKPPESVTPAPGSPRDGIVLRALEAMLKIRIASVEGDSSDRLFAVACRAVEYGLNDAQALATIKAYAIDQPFKGAYSDRELLARVRQAERRPDVVRGLHAEEVRGSRVEYARLTSAELASGDYSINYLIEGMLAEGQPLIVAGPQKALKTSLIVDAAVSLASGKPFLGMFGVPEARRVAVMSGESGLATLQETAFRICAARGVRLPDLAGLIWSPSLPVFGDPDHLAAVEDFLTADEVGVLFIDPAYMAMPATEPGNLFAQGALLRSMSDLCQRIGVTVVLCHHTKKNTGREAHSAPELGDIAWAGFAEFARQWWLVGRRETFQPGTGGHRLWLSVGGSAGHSALLALDVAEGINSDPGGRRWELEVQDAHSAQQAKQQAAKQAKAEGRATEQRDKAEADKRAIVDAACHLEGQRGFKQEFRELSGLSGSRFTAAWAALLREGVVSQDGRAKAENGKQCDVYQLDYTARK